jgi:hypothetical protein
MPWVGPIESVEFAEPSVSAATFTFSPAGVIPVGTLIVVGFAQNTATTTLSGADNSTQPGAANVYSLVSAQNTTLLTGGARRCEVTRPILPTDVITITTNLVATRRHGRLLTFTGGGSAGFDQVVDETVDTSSPIDIGPTGTLKSDGELVLGWSFWTGGAVLSGVADVTSGYTLVAGNGSGGITTRVETNVSYKTTATTAAETDSHSFTSITRALGCIEAFQLPTQAGANFQRRGGMVVA